MFWNDGEARPQRDSEDERRAEAAFEALGAEIVREAERIAASSGVECSRSSAEGLPSGLGASRRGHLRSLVCPAFVPRVTGTRQESMGMNRAKNPQVKSRVRSSAQVVKPRPRERSQVGDTGSTPIGTARHNGSPRCGLSRTNACGRRLNAHPAVGVGRSGPSSGAHSLAPSAGLGRSV
jgi:hypothetical protein